MIVHFRKGSLLEYNGVYLAEGPWPAKAYFDAKRRARQRDAGLYMDYGFTRPAVFSQGPFPQFQHTDGTSGNTGPIPTEAQGAQPEEVSPPRPAAPSRPNQNFELPAPIMRSSEAASASSRPRMSPAGADDCRTHTDQRWSSSNVQLRSSDRAAKRRQDVRVAIPVGECRQSRQQCPPGQR